jgi:hypothetical protein
MHTMQIVLPTNSIVVRNVLKMLKLTVLFPEIF